MRRSTGAGGAYSALQPELAGVHANLGLIYRKTGRLEESAAALQGTVKVGYTRAQITYGRAFSAVIEQRIAQNIAFAPVIGL